MCTRLYSSYWMCVSSIRNASCPFLNATKWLEHMLMQLYCFSAPCLNTCNHFSHSWVCTAIQLYFITVLQCLPRSSSPKPFAHLKSHHLQSCHARVPQKASISKMSALLSVDKHLWRSLDHIVCVLYVHMVVMLSIHLVCLKVFSYCQHATFRF